jgi:protease PrsW
MRFPLLTSRRRLHALSRDPGTLRRAVLFILALFLLNAAWLGWVRPPALPEQSVAERRAQKLRVVLEAAPLDRTALVRALREDAALLKEMDDETDSLDLPALLLAAGGLTVAEQEAFSAWHLALLTKNGTPELIESLTVMAMPEAPALAPTMAADLKRLNRDDKAAMADYEAIGALPEGVEARRRAVDLALSREWRETVDRLMALPAYYQAVHSLDDQLSRRVAREQLDVREIFRRTLDYTASLLRQTVYLILSLLVGAVWFVSLHKASRLPRRQWWISLAGIPLGFISTVITLVLGDLQEARQGLAETGLAGPDLLFQIASVGLREESSKLVCVLPLLLILRKGTPAQALMAASCVGLGFAVKENIGYYQRSDGAGALSRFITANFMHLAMTGLTGHALFRFLRYPKNYGPAFMATFVGMVLLHGFYNFSLGGYDNLISRELSSLFPVMVAGLAFFYFQTVRRDQDDAPQAISAHAVFVLGTTVVIGTLFNFLVWQGGWGPAIQAIVPSVLSSAVFCWLFMHLLRDA